MGRVALTDQARKELGHHHVLAFPTRRTDGYSARELGHDAMLWIAAIVMLLDECGFGPLEIDGRDLVRVDPARLTVTRDHAMDRMTLEYE